MTRNIQYRPVTHISACFAKYMYIVAYIITLTGRGEDGAWVDGECGWRVYALHLLQDPYEALPGQHGPQ